MTIYLILTTNQPPKRDYRHETILSFPRDVSRRATTLVPWAQLVPLWGKQESRN